MGINCDIARLYLFGIESKKKNIITHKTTHRNLTLYIHYY